MSTSRLELLQDTLKTVQLNIHTVLEKEQVRHDKLSPTGSPKQQLEPPSQQHPVAI